jgi:hypothetical protein
MRLAPCPCLPGNDIPAVLAIDTGVEEAVQQAQAWLRAQPRAEVLECPHWAIIVLVSRLRAPGYLLLRVEGIHLPVRARRR